MTTQTTYGTLVKCLSNENLTAYRNRKNHTVSYKCNFELTSLIKGLVTQSGGTVNDQFITVNDSLDGRQIAKKINTFIEYKKSHNNVHLRNTGRFTQDHLNNVHESIQYFNFTNTDSQLYGNLSVNFDNNVYICKVGSKSILARTDLAGGYIDTFKRGKCTSTTFLYMPQVEQKTDDINFDDLPF
jgi:hypothetical protein